MLKNSTGSSTIGCLVTIAIVVCGFYTGYKFAAVQWNVESFKEALTESTRFWANEYNPDKLNIAGIKADVIQRAEKCAITLTNKDITVNTEGSNIAISVSWVEEIEFPGGYIYKWERTVSRNIKKIGH